MGPFEPYSKTPDTPCSYKGLSYDIELSHGKLDNGYLLLARSIPLCIGIKYL